MFGGYKVEISVLIGERSSFLLSVARSELLPQASVPSMILHVSKRKNAHFRIKNWKKTIFGIFDFFHFPK